MVILEVLTLPLTLIFNQILSHFSFKTQRKDEKI